MTGLRKVTLIGSGNWGSCIAKIVGNNISQNPKFEKEVRMWVFEETVNGRKLTEIINQEHENTKYLPGVKLPPNVVAIPDLAECTKDADVLIFCVPHQFINRALDTMKPHVKKTAYGVSLMKGLSEDSKGGVRLITDTIRDTLGIPCGVLMGANLAPEVANENFCEATIGIKDRVHGDELKSLFQTDYFRIVVTEDEVGVELCGALKNIVALAAGFAEGLGYGENTKAAIIRIGFMEMKKFMFDFFGKRGINEDTFLESCGMADLVTTCYGGRNRKVAIEHAKTGRPMAQIEKEVLGGQSAQGPLTAREVNMTLRVAKREADFPVLTSVHKVCQGEMDIKKLMECLRNHPVHLHAYNVKHPQGAVSSG